MASHLLINSATSTGFNPVSLQSIDEVWEGLLQAKTSFERDGHRPNPAPSSCHNCYALYLVENAMNAYLARLNRQPAGNN